MYTIWNHCRALITLLLSSSACFNCSQPVTPVLLHCSVLSSHSPQSQHHCWEKARSDLSLSSASSNKAVEIIPLNPLWSPCADLASRAVQTYGHMLASNFNLYMSFPWDIITLLKWKFVSVYIRKITLWQKMWKSLHDKSSMSLTRSTVTHRTKWKCIMLKRESTYTIKMEILRFQVLSLRNSVSWTK